MNNNAETFINDWVIEEWNKTDKFLVYSVHEGDTIKVSRRLWGKNMNKCKDEFHKWIINEWKQKDRPEVWVVGENSKCRLWEHECERFYVNYYRNK